MAEITKIGKVNPSHKGFQELYRRGEEFIVVSTVGELADSPGSPDEAAIVRLAGLAGGYAISGEETMAFPADSEGNITDWGEIAVANGPSSRDAVLRQLEAEEVEDG